MDPWRAYSVEKDAVCQGCRAIASVQRDLEKTYEKSPAALDGRRLYIVRSRRIDPLSLMP